MNPNEDLWIAQQTHELRAQAPTTAGLSGGAIVTFICIVVLLAIALYFLGRQLHRQGCADAHRTKRASGQRIVRVEYKDKEWHVEYSDGSEIVVRNTPERPFWAYVEK